MSRSSRCALRMMISSNEFRTGTTIEMDGVAYKVVEFLHVKPGKGAAFVRTKLKNLKTGNNVDKTFKAGEMVQTASMEKLSMQHTYMDDGYYVFMNMETFDEERLTAEQLGPIAVKFMTEGLEVAVLKHSDKVIGVEIPKNMTFKVTRCDPGLRGNTAQGNVTKPATIETGAEIAVPLFIKEGENIVVNTIDSKYNACTLHTYLFERRIMDLYGVLGVGLDSSAAGVEKRLFESVVKHLLLAVGELHASGFVHRDVKPSNILVVSGETRGSCRFKLIDFGSCKDVRPFSSWFNGQLDTLDPLYGAPETRFSLGNDAYKFDVFSVGMIGLAAAYGSLRSEDSLRRFRRRMEAAQWNLLRVERESAVDGSGWRLGDNERVTRVLRGMLCGRAGGRLHVHDALHELHAAYVQ
ncbi:unnamed protein product [Agarophyton chilense]